MKSVLTFFLLIASTLWLQSQTKKRQVLFIGNSYTYFNNLPQLVEQLALAKGDTLVTDSYAPGGYTFNNHFNDLNCKAKIYSKKWDMVVLQAQSQEPSFSPAQVNAQTLPFALKLDSLIKDNHPCSETVFFETWGRKNGDASNCAAYPPICTYTGMQNRLKQSYKLFADLTSGLMAPAGEAFRESILQQPGLELYQADQSHPSLEGSYLSACVFYESLFQKSVLGNTFNGGVNASTASFLQAVAHKVVNDSLNLWNFGVHHPWANFTYTALTASSFYFQSVSPNLTSTWFFGDGSFTSAPHFTHTYSQSGSYTVSHVVQDNCNTDSVALTVVVQVPLSWQEYEADQEFNLFPNPANDRVLLNYTRPRHVQVYTLSGQMILEATVQDELMVKELNEGLYWFRQEDEPGSVYKRLLISRP